MPSGRVVAHKQVATVETTTRRRPSNGLESTEKILPEQYYRIMDTVPPNTFGIERVRYYTGEVNKLPESVKGIVRERFNDFVREMVQKNASDLDMGGDSCKGYFWYRVDGFKRPYPDLGKYSADECELFLLSMLVPQQQDQLLKRFSIDFGYSLAVAPNEPDRRFRNTIFFDNKRLALSMRMLPWKPRPLRSYGFHPIIERGLLFRFIRDGITLITGVTGSGKSTMRS
jgi:twitching motility protein PilT